MVKSPSHINGNILDLIITTNNDSINNIETPSSTQIISSFEHN